MSLVMLNFLGRISFVTVTGTTLTSSALLRKALMRIHIPSLFTNFYWVKRGGGALVVKCVCTYIETYLYYLQVFLMTHLSFATSRDVLEALINCMQSPRALPDVPPNAIFTFMEPGTVRPCSV